MSQTFKPGDLVKLNTGSGPRMTVKGNLPDDRGNPTHLLICQWFDEARLQEAAFAPESLVAAPGSVP